MDKQPIFQSIFNEGFDEGWDSLSPVMHQHYANRPYSNDLVTVEGSMEITMSPLAKLFSPLFRFTKTLVPKAGKNVAVTVHFRSEPDTSMFCFEREFRFPDGAVHRFYSRLEPIGGNQVVEWTGSGVGWHAGYSYSYGDGPGDGPGDGKIMLKHLGYCIKVRGKRIPLPLGWLFGYGNADETPISDNSFAMAMSIRHPLFGVIYGYSGTFTIKEVRLDE